MKKITKQMILGIILCVLCLMAAGCGGEMTAKELVGKMEQASKAKTITATDMLLDMQASCSMDVFGSEMDMELAMGIDTKMQVNPDPYQSYTAGTISMTMMEESFETPIESYIVMEDNNMAVYTYVDMNDEWSFEATEMTAADYQEYLLSAETLNVEADQITLNESTKKINDKEAYVLNILYTGEQLQSIMKQFGNSGVVGTETMNFSDVSLEGITIPATCYVDTKTFLPIQLEIDLKESGEIVNQLIGQGFGILELQELGVGEIALTVSNYLVELKNIEYDVQDIKELPVDAKEAALFTEALSEVNATLDDGRYILKNGNRAVAIAVVDGHILQQNDASSVTFTTTDNSNVLGYTLSSHSTEEGALEEFETYYTEIFKRMSVSMQIMNSKEELNTSLGDISIRTIDAQGVPVYYSVVPINEMYICVSYMDFNHDYEKSADIMLPAIEAISELTLEDLQ